MLKLLPWRHFGRKNIGYLYAVAHGAQQIWDFDDDNGLNKAIKPEVPAGRVYHISLQQNCEAFNPYPAMGAPDTPAGLGPAAWPRGLPLSLVRRNCKFTLQPGNTKNVTVVQSLAQHEPDVDGIFRLTRTVPFYFKDALKKTLVIPNGTLTPYNAQATLVLLPGFWTLLLPVTVSSCISINFHCTKISCDAIQVS